MPTGRSFIQHLRRAVLIRDGAGLSDGQLLASFLEAGDEAAFEALVRRHGPVVLGVCRRVLGNVHDAEDAFQATFLVLVRKAASIVPRELVGNWLYGVAYRIALAAQTKNSRRRTREKQVTDMPQPAIAAEVGRRELRAILDQELSRLPEKYRVPVILCELAGRSRKEVARQLDVPEGTLSSRLATARRMLAKRLAGRGLAVSAGALALVLAEQTAASSVPVPLTVSVVKAATLFAAGHAATELISAKVAALTQGALKAMFLTNLKIASALLISVALFGTGAGLLTHPTRADKPTDKRVNYQGKQAAVEVNGVVKTVDASQNTLTIHPSKAFPQEMTFSLAAEAKVFLDDGTGDKLGFLEGKLTDLADGVLVTLRFQDQKVVRIWVEGPTVQGIVKGADASNNTITATVGLMKGESPADRTFALANNASLSIDDGKAKDKSKPAQKYGLADLPAGAVVFLKLSADRKVVGSIRAEGQSIRGVLKALDPARRTITVTVSRKGEAAADKTFAVDKNAGVFIDDGKTKDKLQGSGLGDLPVGANVTVRLSLDQQCVLAIRAEGAGIHGSVKAVDAANNTITLYDKVESEKTYSVLKDATVSLDGKAEPRTLADVPVDSVVSLKLLADQKSVREVQVSGPTVFGTVSAKPVNDSVTITNKEGDKTFAIAKDVRITIDDGRAGKVADLIDGTVVQLRLSADQAAALEIAAEGPSFHGTVKALDPDKNTITLTIGGKNGVGGEDKEFKLTKNTRIVTQVYGAPLRREDLRADKEVILRLSIDQKAAGRITVIGE